MSDIPVTEIFKAEKEDGMTPVTAQATIKDEEGDVIEYRKATINYGFGADLDEAIRLHGKDTVYDLYFAQGKVKVQGTMRADLGSDDPDKVTSVAQLPIGAARDRVPRDPVSAGEAAFERMTPEQRDAFLQMIAQKAAAA